MKLKSLCAFAMLSSGCIIIDGVRVGPVQPKSPAGCPVAYARLAPIDATPNYIQVGSLCAWMTETDFYSEPKDSTHEALETRACDLGGDTLSVIGTCDVHRYPGVQIGVFRKRARVGT